MKIGIFGGTFDPPHIGHLILAAECCYQLCLDRLLWVVTADPPHKQGRLITPIEIRLEMVQATISGDPDFEISRIDIDRPPPHYAIDTIRLLRTDFPLANLVYLMGGDSLHDLPDWHTPQQFVEEADGIGVMRRPSDQINIDLLKNQIPGITEKLHFVEAPLLEISGQEIRQRASRGAPYRYYLPVAVYEIIQRLDLYRTL